MRTLCVAATIVALLMPAPDAVGQPAAAAERKEPYSPGLVEMMNVIQIHHAKLGLAGERRNWDLADYQLEELKESLEDVVKYSPVYKDVPVGQMIESTIMAPIAEVEAAINARDRARFASTFGKLTVACNTCHQATNRAFIVIQRPAASSFPNQSFAPKRK